MAVNTWIAEEAGQASTDANWSLGHAPTTGEDVVFDDTSVNNCAWDVTDTIDSLSINTGYTGKVSQGNNDINIGDGGFIQEDGGFSGKSTQWIVNLGNWNWSAGTFYTNSVNLQMTGIETVITFPNADSTKFKVLRISGETSITYSGAQFLMDNGMIDVGAKLTVPIDKILMIRYYDGSSYQLDNDGIIEGAGNIKIVAYNGAKDINLGTITSTLRIYLFGGGGSQVLTCTSNSILGTLLIDSNHGVETVTLDTNGYNLSCTDFTADTRGIGDFGSSEVKVSGDLDYSSGAIVADTSKVILTGIDKTITGNGSDKLYDLIIQPEATQTLGANLGVSNKYVNLGSLTEGAYALTQDNPKHIHAGFKVADEIDMDVYPLVGIVEQDLFMDVNVASTTGIHAAITGTGAENEVTTAITNPDNPRNVSITTSDNATPSGDVVIAGTDALGDSISDTITIVAGYTAYGVKAFSTVTSITIPAGVTAGDTVSIGTSDKLGLKNSVYISLDVFKVKKNNAHMDSDDYTIDTTYNTIDLAPIGGGDDYTIWYRST